MIQRYLNSIGKSINFDNTLGFMTIELEIGVTLRDIFLLI